MQSEAKNESVAELSALRDKLKADHVKGSEATRETLRNESVELRRKLMKLKAHREIARVRNDKVSGLPAEARDLTGADQAVVATELEAAERNVEHAEARLREIATELEGLTRPPELEAVMVRLRDARQREDAERRASYCKKLQLEKMTDADLERLHHETAAQFEPIVATLEAVSAERSRRAQDKADDELIKGLTPEQRRRFAAKLEREIAAEEASKKT